MAVVVAVDQVQVVVVAAALLASASAFAHVGDRAGEAGPGLRSGAGGGDGFELIAVGDLDAVPVGAVQDDHAGVVLGHAVVSVKVSFLVELHVFLADAEDVAMEVPAGTVLHAALLSGLLGREVLEAVFADLEGVTGEQGGAGVERDAVCGDTVQIPGSRPRPPGAKWSWSQIPDSGLTCATGDSLPHMRKSQTGIADSLSVWDNSSYGFCWITR